MAGESFSKWIELPGSRKAKMPGARLGEAIAPREKFDVTVRLRRRKPLPATPPAPGRQMTHAQYAAEHGADPADIAKVKEFAGHFGLKVKAVLPAQRSILLDGTAAQFSAAFRVALREHLLPDNTSYRGRDGSISIPEDLGYCVVGVFGLDNRRVAWPQFRSGKMRRQAETAAAGAKFQTQGTARAFFPNELAKMYNFPEGVDGTGQTIGLVELGGGFRQEDLDAYFAKAGVPSPTISVGTVVGGATNQPAPDADGQPDVEVLLDMEVAGSVAPGAKMVVYFVNDGSDQQCLRGVASAIHDESAKISVLSLSWGGPEFEPGSFGESANVQKQYQDNLNDMLQTAAHLGITVCVSSGDFASAGFPLDDFQRPWDGHAHVMFPASSPFALACGGTHVIDPAGPREESWHPSDNAGTGGGVSRYFPTPDYQEGVVSQKAVNPAGNAGRGLPDVAADSSQESGYRLLVDGQWYPDPEAKPDPLLPVGGTSAAAPLWAGLVARLNQALGLRLGFLNPMLYTIGSPSAAFHDIALGNNGDYKTAPGWDPCTGLGTPDGQALLEALRPLVVAATSAQVPSPARRRGRKRGDGLSGPGRGRRPIRPPSPLAEQVPHQTRQVGDGRDLGGAPWIAVEQEAAEPGTLGAQDVVLGFIADAEHPAGRQAQPVAGGAVEAGVRLADADLRGDHQVVIPRPRELREAADDAAESAVEVRPDDEPQPRAAEGVEGGADVAEGPPGRAAAEMIPKLGERRLGVRQIGQDVGDDPPPAAMLGRLVGGERPPLLVDLILAEVSLKPALHLAGFERHSLAACRLGIHERHRRRRLDQRPHGIEDQTFDLALHRVMFPVSDLAASYGHCGRDRRGGKPRRSR